MPPPALVTVASGRKINVKWSDMQRPGMNNDPKANRDLRINVINDPGAGVGGEHMRYPSKVEIEREGRDLTGAGYPNELSSIFEYTSLLINQSKCRFDSVLHIHRVAAVLQANPLAAYTPEKEPNCTESSSYQYAIINTMVLSVTETDRPGQAGFASPNKAGRALGRVESAQDHLKVLRSLLRHQESSAYWSTFYCGSCVRCEEVPALAFVNGYNKGRDQTMVYACCGLCAHPPGGGISSSYLATLLHFCSEAHLHNMKLAWGSLCNPYFRAHIAIWDECLYQVDPRWVQIMGEHIAKHALAMTELQSHNNRILDLSDEHQRVLLAVNAANAPWMCVPVLHAPNYVLKYPDEPRVVAGLSPLVLDEDEKVGTNRERLAGCMLEVCEWDDAGIKVVSAKPRLNAMVDPTVCFQVEQRYGHTRTQEKDLLEKRTVQGQSYILLHGQRMPDELAKRLVLSGASRRPARAFASSRIPPPPTTPHPTSAAASSSTSFSPVQDVGDAQSRVDPEEAQMVGELPDAVTIWGENQFLSHCEKTVILPNGERFHSTWEEYRNFIPESISAFHNIPLYVDSFSASFARGSFIETLNDPARQSRSKTPPLRNPRDRRPVRGVSPRTDRSPVTRALLNPLDDTKYPATETIVKELQPVLTRPLFMRPEALDEPPLPGSVSSELLVGATVGFKSTLNGEWLLGSVESVTPTLTVLEARTERLVTVFAQAPVRIPDSQDNPTDARRWLVDSWEVENRREEDPRYDASEFTPQGTPRNPLDGAYLSRAVLSTSGVPTHDISAASSPSLQEADLLNQGDLENSYSLLDTTVQATAASSQDPSDTAMQVDEPVQSRGVSTPPMDLQSLMDIDVPPPSFAEARGVPVPKAPPAEPLQQPMPARAPSPVFGGVPEGGQASTPFVPMVVAPVGIPEAGRPPFPEPATTGHPEDVQTMLLVLTQFGASSHEVHLDSDQSGTVAAVSFRPPGGGPSCLWHRSGATPKCLVDRGAGHWYFDQTREQCYTVSLVDQRVTGSSTTSGILILLSSQEPEASQPTGLGTFFASQGTGIRLSPVSRAQAFAPRASTSASSASDSESDVSVLLRLDTGGQNASIQVDEAPEVKNNRAILQSLNLCDRANEPAATGDLAVSFTAARHRFSYQSTLQPVEAPTIEIPRSGLPSTVDFQDDPPQVDVLLSVAVAGEHVVSVGTHSAAMQAGILGPDAGTGGSERTEGLLPPDPEAVQRAQQWIREQAEQNAQPTRPHSLAAEPESPGPAEDTSAGSTGIPVQYADVGAQTDPRQQVDHGEWNPFQQSASAGSSPGGAQDQDPPAAMEDPGVTTAAQEGETATVGQHRPDAPAGPEGSSPTGEPNQDPQASVDDDGSTTDPVVGVETEGSPLHDIVD